MDAILDIGLSRSPGFLDRGNDHIVSESIDGKQEIAPKYKTAFKNGERFDGIVLHQLRERYQRYREGEQLPDFFEALIEGRDSIPNILPWGELAAELSIMLNAGSVSTAIAINNTMYMLLKNPESLAKLRAELDLVVDGDTVLAYEQSLY
ncbi:hypothetical protein ACHAQD_009244 [Fusarium lateritium]